jgi:fructose-bisphosphate aldolase, class I
VSRQGEQADKIKTGAGFIAALDQSGGSTPKALGVYGVSPHAWSTEAQMFDLVHEMRTRIMTSPAFSGERIIAAILFERTMDREVLGKATADYLWQEKRIVPILKVDQGLTDEADGVQLMKPIAGLSDLLARAKRKHIFGTKMRSVIKQANPSGISAIVEQQFEFGKQILSTGLVPILEPEIDIHCPEKAAAETLLKRCLAEGLKSVGVNERVMFKLTLPEADDFYSEFVTHPRLLKVVALSGGYTQAEANQRLARNHGVVASFSRALTEGLTAQQSDAEFNATLDRSTRAIFEASMA